MTKMYWVVGAALTAAVVFAAVRDNDRVKQVGEVFKTIIDGDQVACTRIAHPSGNGFLCVNQ